MRTWKSFLGSLLGTARRRRPVHKRRPLGRFEPLEERKLLSVTIGGKATVAYGYHAQSAIPAAHVSIQFTGTDNQSHTLTTGTSSNGAYSASNASLTLKPGTNVTVTLQAGVPGTTQFWIMNPANSNAVWQAVSTGAPTVSDQTSFNYDVVVGGIDPRTTAFEICSTLQNVYVPYAQSLGATLRDKLPVSFSAVDARTGDFTVSPDGTIQLNITRSVAPYPDGLGHLFAHVLQRKIPSFVGC